MIRRVSLKTLQGHCTILDSLEHVPFNGSLSSVINSKVVRRRSATRLPCDSGLIRCLVRSSRCSRREWYRCKKKGPQIIFSLPSFKTRGTRTSLLIMGFATLETRRKLGRVNFCKDFWDVDGDAPVRYWPFFSLFSISPRIGSLGEN